jgi:hypothetical protein
MAASKVRLEDGGLAQRRSGCDSVQRFGTLLSGEDQVARESHSRTGSEEPNVSGADRCSGPAAGIVNALIMCAGIYGLLVGVALAGGRSALLMCLLLLMGLLHGCLAGLARSAVTSASPPVALERSARHFLSDQQR